MTTWYFANLRKMIPIFFSFWLELASISKLHLAVVVVQNASMHKLHWDLIARLSVRNDKHLLLGTMIVWQISGFGLKNSLHSNKFFFDKSKSIPDIKYLSYNSFLDYYVGKDWKLKKVAKNWIMSPTWVWTHIIEMSSWTDLKFFASMCRQGYEIM